ncbi:MAG: amidohydrolase family protein [Candidatus Latescibacterota bacterium]
MPTIDSHVHFLSNLFAKASALYAAAPWDYRSRRAPAFLGSLVRVLGADRVLWGSDWPPLANHQSYRQALEVVRREARGLAAEDRRLILGENAARVFAV